MRKRQRTYSSGGIALTAIGAVVVALVLAVIPGQGWAAVTCPATETGADFDGDGLTDFQECNGITLADGSVVPPCPSPGGRSACLDPNTKDLFVIYAPATAGSLLPVGFNPFGSVTAYGVAFNGLTDLGITVHQITPAQAAADRSVTSVEKAVRVAESLDANGSILGYCQWGTPSGLDGCTIYTQRIKNFINSTCTGLQIVTPAGIGTTVDDAFLAYAIHTFLHETGHTTGGMTATYNSSYGGYHYKCGAGTLMEQCVTYSTKGGKCKFNMSTGWNTTLDAPTVNLR